VNNHLSEDQITEWMLGTRDDFVSRHLATCHACSVAVEELRSTISCFRDSIHATAQRDNSFWREQQLAIRERVSVRNWYPLHWAWVAAMAMVLIAAIFLTRTANPPQNKATEDADKALLQEVQGDLVREVPEALAPAVLIAEERNEILTNKDTQQMKSTLRKRREIK
jgi:negative regulator of sigma E activity